MTSSHSSQIRRLAVPVGAAPVPDAFKFVTVRQEAHDQIPVTVTRAESGPQPQYGAEHVTTVIGSRDQVLYGFTRQLRPTGEDELPTTAAARRAAFAFLNEVDPRHTAGLTEQWIDQHDESITSPNGDTHTVSGMKVKTRHRNGLYTWVIVGAGGEIITYERDITWDSGHSRRLTAMWLHDRWIAAHDAGGPELPAPAAPLT